MLTSIYVLHDITAESHTYPFFAHNDQIATRSVSNMVNQPGSTVYDNPEDFRLYRIGTYNDENALIENTERTFIVRASDLVKKTTLLPNLDEGAN